MPLRSLYLLAALAPLAAAEAQQDADTLRSRPQQLDTLTAVAPRRGYAGPGVSGAARQPMLWRETPQAVTIVTRQQVQDQGHVTLAEVARSMPGITFAQGEGHRDAPTIRGQATTSSFFVDGLRDDVQYYRDLYATERVEAVKGPSALAFGRGPGGGIINRVLKTAGFTPVRSLELQGATFGGRRAVLDLGQALSGTVAARVNAVYENTDLFRDFTSYERYGVAPTASMRLGAHTTVTASAEVFHDSRTVDRGLPSFNGLPFRAARTAFFGDPAQSRSRLDMRTGTVGLEHFGSRVTVRSRTQYGFFDKFYNNVFPGSAVRAADSTLTLSSYDNLTERWNFLHQTDAVFALRTGGVRHQVLAGVDVGRQVSRNLRQTGFFNGTDAALRVSAADAVSSLPVTYRAVGSDNDNRGYLTTVAGFVQDQVTIAPWLSVLAGLRVERFDLSVNNFRTNETLTRVDNLVSPRAGLVFTPAGPVAFYGSWSVAQLPSSGEQFASLTPTQSTIRPERFENLEAGAKIELPRGLAASVAVYRLDRTNTTAPSPTDAAVLVQTGAQRTDGIEVDVAGSPVRGWQVVAGYAHQDARITARTTAAAPGAFVPSVPRHALSLWNRVDLPRGFGLGFGVIRQSSMFAAIDNAVTLPGFTRVDAAAFVPVTRSVQAQVNVENVFDRGYFTNAHNNNNITPGTPRLVRVTLRTAF